MITLALFIGGRYSEAPRFRAGDVISAGIVFALINCLILDLVEFGWANILFTLLWLALTAWLIGENKKLAHPQPNAGESTG